MSTYVFMSLPHTNRRISALSGYGMPHFSMRGQLNCTWSGSLELLNMERLPTFALTRSAAVWLLDVYFARLFLLLVVGAIGGCGSVPRAPDRDDDRGATIALAAGQLIGSPYHFGGADAQGFDCSGLVVYVHERAGLEVPRTADEQRRAAHPVPLDAVMPGDVLFFRTRFHISAHRVDHVGIYAGKGHFIHAPRSGAPVSYASLDAGYYRRHLVSAGRFWDGRASK
jgi:murein DD-endopeptidase